MPFTRLVKRYEPRLRATPRKRVVYEPRLRSSTCVGACHALTTVLCGGIYWASTEVHYFRSTWSFHVAGSRVRLKFIGLLHDLHLETIPHSTLPHAHAATGGEPARTRGVGVALAAGLSQHTYVRHQRHVTASLGPLKD